MMSGYMLNKYFYDLGDYRTFDNRKTGGFGQGQVYYERFFYPMVNSNGYAMPLLQNFYYRKTV
jgi:hypothetical protein